MYHSATLKPAAGRAAAPIGYRPNLEAAASEDPLVLVVDDDDDVRDAIVDVLESVGLEALGFSSPADLIDNGLPDRPGCLILDVRMPGGSGLDVQRNLLERGDRKPVIFLTGHGDIEMSVEAMKGGAVDFLTKPVRHQTLLDAVRAGIARDLAQRVEDRLTRHHVGRVESLTPRERQVFRAVALGRANKQIAYDLGISVVTVKLHRSSAMRKMGVATIGELIRAWEALPREIRAGRSAAPLA